MAFVSDGVFDVPLCLVVVGPSVAAALSGIHRLGASCARQGECGMPVRSRPMDSLGARVIPPREPGMLTSLQ